MDYLLRVGHAPEKEYHGSFSIPVRLRRTGSARLLPLHFHIVYLNIAKRIRFNNNTLSPAQAQQMQFAMNYAVRIYL
jgi:hypothetical protein